MIVPAELKYSRDHEWVRLGDDGVATVGITDFAQDQLGDIVYVDLPKVGSSVGQFEKCGEVESVKSVSDLFSPVSGEVTERNDDLSDAPERVNQKPYGEGWLLRVRLVDPTEVEQLLDADAYRDLIAAAAH